MGNISPRTYERWFDGYTRTFLTGSEKDRKNIELKAEHSLRVRENALQIAAGLGLGGDDRSLAGTIGILHDVGRFPQFRDYGTFRDSISTNHAALGAKVLLEQQVLRELPPRDRDLIIRAVALHNVLTLPPLRDERLALHCKLVRDADKLDIWRVFIDLLALPAAERPSAAELGLPDTPDCSPAVLGQLAKGEMVTLASLRTLNDFKLLQLAWIYDLHFFPSFHMVKEREVIDRLAFTLPGDAAILRSLDRLRAHVDERLQQAANSPSGPDRAG